MNIVEVDPGKQRKVLDPVTNFPIYEHILWCWVNCRSRWYNECDYYSYICIEDQRDALAFALRFKRFNSEQEKMWLTLVWS